MIALERIIHMIPDFSAWNHAEKIRLFSWYVARSGTEPFKTSDIENCFDGLRLKKPSAIAPFLRAMANREPPQLIHCAGTFRLERHFLQSFNDRFGVSEPALILSRDLEQLQERLTDEVERSYLKETLLCLAHGAHRASILMAWNLSFHHLVQWIVSHRLDVFNEQLSKTYPKLGFRAQGIDDFTYLKEDQVLTVARSARLISNSVFKITKEKLDRRNAVAHPSRLVVGSGTAEEYVRDVIDNIVLSL